MRESLGHSIAVRTSAEDGSVRRGTALCLELRGQREDA